VSWLVFPARGSSVPRVSSLVYLVGSVCAVVLAPRALSAAANRACCGRLPSGSDLPLAPAVAGRDPDRPDGLAFREQPSFESAQQRVGHASVYRKYSVVDLCDDHSRARRCDIAS
jgi:hypothetical protein